MSSPKHIAVIMDGNGRWAKARGHNRVFGHVRGMKTVRRTVECAVELGLEQLTLFALSNENWSRPEFEILSLMKILRKFLKTELKFLIKNNIRLKTIGDISRLPEDIQDMLAETKEATSSNDGLCLCLAISYGSKQEIRSAVQRLAKKAIENPAFVDQITTETISQELETSELSDPDMIIRTSGEYRLSNFLLFQAAYSELYFTEKLWPDFSKQDFIEAIDWYHSRERRFGKTSAQLHSETRKPEIQI
jgi:undecaprenyl diphosphate synthase